MRFLSVLSATAASLAAGLALFALPSAYAQDDHTDDFARSVMSRSTAKALSNEGNLLFLAAGTLYPLTRHGINDIHGQNQSLRIIDTAITATALTTGLKYLVRSQRPDGSTHDSFPSGHATAAFAVAAMEANYDRHNAPFWYAGAALISLSRIRLNRHRWEDIAAGAAIGIGTAEIERHQSRGLLIAPIFGSALTRREKDGPSNGVAFSLTY